MRSIYLALAPVAVSGHGIAMPMTDNVVEAKAAGLKMVDEIAEIVVACSKEVVECAPAALKGWEAGASCLIEKFDSVKSDNCQDKIHHAARHLPLALYASGKRNIDDDGEQKELDGLGDFGKRVNNGCDLENDVIPYTWSYHIHIQWNFGCDECKQTALNWTDKFLAEFQPEARGDAQMCHRMAFLTDLWNTNSIPRDQPERHHYAEICTMATLPPGGPFIHSEKGFAISPTMFHKALPWMMANRPINDELKIFVHPNTGCQYNDIRHWSGWVGPSVRMFYPILKGCVWASCEDAVLGCIAFNHLGKHSGYNQCYTPPTDFNLGCTYKLQKHSNTSTVECVEASESVV